MRDLQFLWSVIGVRDGRTRPGMALLLSHECEAGSQGGFDCVICACGAHKSGGPCLLCMMDGHVLGLPCRFLHDHRAGYVVGGMGCVNCP